MQPIPPEQMAPLPEAASVPLETVNRLMERLDAVVRAFEKVSTVVEQAPGAVAMLTDAVDDAVRRAGAAGIDADERLRNALLLAERLTAPATVTALTGLLDRLDRVAPVLDLLDQAPGMVAMLVDTVDHAYRQAAASGVDLETTMQRAALAASKLKALMLSDEFRALMESGVLQPETLRVVGSAGDALAEVRRAPAPAAGPVALLRGLRDPDVQRALGFALSFARQFGRALQRPA